MIITHNEAKEIKPFLPIIEEWKQGTDLQEATFICGECEWSSTDHINTTKDPEDYRLRKIIQTYDWKMIPPWFNYMAFDEDGKLFAYTSMPTRTGNSKSWESPSLPLLVPRTYAPKQVVDWKDSMEHRP